MALERGLTGTLVFLANFTGEAFLDLFTEEGLSDFLDVDVYCFFEIFCCFFGVVCFFGVGFFFGAACFFGVGVFSGDTNPKGNFLCIVFLGVSYLNLLLRLFTSNLFV